VRNGPIVGRTYLHELARWTTSSRACQRSSAKWFSRPVAAIGNSRGDIVCARVPDHVACETGRLALIGPAVWPRMRATRKRFLEYVVSKPQWIRGPRRREVRSASVRRTTTRIIAAGDATNMG